MTQKSQRIPINILLADDDPDDRFFFEEALKQIPINTRVATVNHGEQLMEYLLTTSDPLPDVLFLDVSMPRKTGFECLIEIRNERRLAGLQVIMFTTSYTRTADLDKQLSGTLADMGANDFIRKPSGFEQVRNVLNEALNRLIERENFDVERTGVIDVIKAPVHLKRMNILLADDDIDDRDFFMRALKAVPLPTELTTVPDGQALMEYLSKNTDRLPHVLFLDINMPRKNGFECLAEIKQDKLLKDLPVVMFSTSNEQDKISILFKSGADLYIRKPANFAALVQVIHHALPIATENIFSNGKLKYIFNP
jgi:CheY-like chemotaxis protein